MPLAGSESGGFGLLQTPPLDLKRVEVIKGVASALYGGSALGGVLNLVSMPPGGDPQLLLNRTSREGADAAGFVTGSLSSHWGYTLSAGANHQGRQDLDDDAWADLARYQRYTFRPRLFFDDGSGRTLFMTAGVVDEDRAGGSMPGQTLPDGSTFIEALHTTRIDGGAVGRMPLDDGRILSARVSATVADHDRRFGDDRIQDTQTTLVRRDNARGRARGIPGCSARQSGRTSCRSAMSRASSYTYTVPVDLRAGRICACRLGDPRGERPHRCAQRLRDILQSATVSRLFMPADRWTVRTSIGTGFAAPTPFVDEIESTGLGVLDPLTGLQAERAASASVDAQWAANGWEANLSLFGSEIRHPLEVLPSATPGRLALVERRRPRRALGAEAFLRYVAGPLQVIGSYTYLDVTEADSAGGRRSGGPRAAPDGGARSAPRGRGAWPHRCRGLVHRASRT